MILLFDRWQQSTAPADSSGPQKGVVRDWFEKTKIFKFRCIDVGRTGGARPLSAYRDVVDEHHGRRHKEQNSQHCCPEHKRLVGGRHDCAAQTRAKQPTRNCPCANRQLIRQPQGGPASCACYSCTTAMSKRRAPGRETVDGPPEVIMEADQAALVLPANAISAGFCVVAVEARNYKSTDDGSIPVCAGHVALFPARTVEEAEKLTTEDFWGHLRGDANVLGLLAGQECPWSPTQAPIAGLLHRVWTRSRTAFLYIQVIVRVNTASSKLAAVPYSFSVLAHVLRACAPDQRADNERIIAELFRASQLYSPSSQHITHAASSAIESTGLWFGMKIHGTELPSSVDVVETMRPPSAYEPFTTANGQRLFFCLHKFAWRTQDPGFVARGHGGMVLGGSWKERVFRVLETMDRSIPTVWIVDIALATVLSDMAKESGMGGGLQVFCGISCMPGKEPTSTTQLCVFPSSFTEHFSPDSAMKWAATHPLVRVIVDCVEPRSGELPLRRTTTGYSESILESAEQHVFSQAARFCTRGTALRRLVLAPPGTRFDSKMGALITDFLCATDPGERTDLFGAASFFRTSIMLRDNPAPNPPKLLRIRCSEGTRTDLLRLAMILQISGFQTLPCRALMALFAGQASALRDIKLHTTRTVRAVRSDDSCPICVERRSLVAYAAPCGHPMCLSCAATLVSLNTEKCPVCRCQLEPGKMFTLCFSETQTIMSAPLPMTDIALEMYFQSMTFPPPQSGFLLVVVPRRADIEDWTSWRWKDTKEIRQCPVDLRYVDATSDDRDERESALRDLARHKTSSDDRPILRVAVVTPPALYSHTFSGLGGIVDLTGAFYCPKTPGCVFRCPMPPPPLSGPHLSVEPILSVMLDLPGPLFFTPCPDRKFMRLFVDHMTAGH